MLAYEHKTGRPVHRWFHLDKHGMIKVIIYSSVVEDGLIVGSIRIGEGSEIWTR